MIEYEFDQMFAEAVHRIGCDHPSRQLRRINIPLKPSQLRQLPSPRPLRHLTSSDATSADTQPRNIAHPDAPP
jgi:hypothetical protein